MVPDEFLLNFLHNSRKGLLELDCRVTIQDETVWSMADCRRYLLDAQRSVLNSTLSQYHVKNRNCSLKSDEVQQRLSTIKNTASVDLAAAVSSHDEAARLALCKLVLFSETHKQIAEENLQTEGEISRSKLLEYFSLCDNAIKLECVQKHLIGSPLFDEADETETTVPQKRLENIQRLLAQAIGIHPNLVTSELTRIFINPATAVQNEFSDDAEVKDLFHQLISRMQTAVAQASLHVNPSSLSDKDKGGVTTVVSVQYSEVGRDGLANAPKREAMELSQQEQIRQIRLASQAKTLQEELLNELEQLSPSARSSKLEHARQVSQEILSRAMKLPTGEERLKLLQGVDPETSRLMTMYRLWIAVHGEEK